MPDAKMSSYALGLSFATPFTPLKWLRSKPEEDDEKMNQNETRNDIDNSEIEEDYNQVLINAGVGGRLQGAKQVFNLMDEETGEEKAQEVTIFHSRIECDEKNLKKKKKKNFFY